MQVCQAQRRRKLRPGFSLLELTLVLVIMGVLISVVVVNVGGSGTKAKIRATQVSLSTIKNAITSYHLEQSAYPPTLQTLVTTKYLESGKMKDGWSQDFFYSSAAGPGEGQPFQLGSGGEDTKLGTTDDISVWDINK